jgi:tRNA(Ile)-lysidine synthase
LPRIYLRHQVACRHSGFGNLPPGRFSLHYVGVAVLSKFARRLWAEWQRLGLPADDCAALLAVSGGADSLALWLAAAELRKAGKCKCGFIIAHFNHGLRPESAEDARWVVAQAAQQGFPCVAGAGRVAQTGNLEQEARRARYEFLQTAAEQAGAGYLLTAHTLDDQAETVLLNLLRGSGPDGLQGMKPLRPLATNSQVRLARPLLRWARRADTESYCRQRGMVPLRDVMNEDERFARVRVRRGVIPLLESFNPQVAEALGRAAELLRGDAEVLAAAAAELLQKARSETSSGTGALLVKVLQDAPEALRLRALRLWIGHGRGDLRRLERQHLRAVERLLSGSQGGRIAELPGGARVERRRGLLLFHAAARD